MSNFNLFRDRRSFLGTVIAGSAGIAAFNTPGFFAEQLAQTPTQTEGPFYPDKMPLDTDNDLLIINDSVTPAVGTITHLGGRILDKRGEPIRDAVVEIWQVDGNGVYLHSGSANRDKRDGNFQGFGRFLTGSTGEYYFRTVKPIAYPGRTAPHIHFAVKMKGRERFTTQCYVKGDPGNATDFVFNSVKDPKQRALLMADYIPVKGSKIGEQSARFEIVLGINAEA
jgi:protocatechuate 3,4-dioxygenase, beta subunit